MDTKDIVWELMVLQDELLDKSQEYRQMFDKRGEGYSDCANLVADLVEKIKEASDCGHSAEQPNIPVVENEQLFDKVQELIQSYCWFDSQQEVDYLKFTQYDWENQLEEVLVTYKIHKNQYHVLRPLLDYFLNEDEDEDIDEKLWDKFVLAYKLENCNV